MSFVEFIDFLVFGLYSFERDRFTSLACDLPIFFSNKSFFFLNYTGMLIKKDKGFSFKKIIVALQTLFDPSKS